MNDVVSFACVVALMALLVNFFITVMEKFGILGWLQAHSNKFFHELLSCAFCRSFWLSLALSVIAFAFTGYWAMLLVPFFVAPIGR